jgi:hypothetical protein
MDDDRPQHDNISLFDLTRNGDPYWTRNMAWTMAQTQIGLFVCPSDTPYDKPDPLVVFFLYPNSMGEGDTMVAGFMQSGASLPLGDYIGVPLGRTNYLGSAGYIGHSGFPPFDLYQGVFYDHSKIDFRDVTDGTSHTLLFGEVMGGETGNLGAGMSYPWIGAGAIGTAWGMSDRPTWGQFGSRHPGIAQFCLVDGSVRPISTSIDQNTYLYLSGIADGHNVECP